MITADGVEHSVDETPRTLFSNPEGSCFSGSEMNMLHGICGDADLDASRPHSRHSFKCERNTSPLLTGNRPLPDETNRSFPAAPEHPQRLRLISPPKTVASLAPAEPDQIGGLYT